MAHGSRLRGLAAVIGRMRMKHQARAAFMTLTIWSTTQAQVLDGEQIQMLLNQAQDIEGCMSELDAAATNTLRARSEQVTGEIERLCKAGKRDEAQARALAFGREMADSPAMQNLKDCAGPLGALLPAALASLNGDASDQLQVCDVH